MRKAVVLSIVYIILNLLGTVFLDEFTYRQPKIFVGGLVIVFLYGLFTSTLDERK